MMPTKLCMTSWRSFWIAYGFSPVFRSTRAVHGVRAGAPGAREAPLGRPRVPRRVGPRPRAEEEKSGQGIPAEAIRAVHAAGHLAGRKEPGQPDRLGRVGVHAHAAHDVVT